MFLGILLKYCNITTGSDCNHSVQPIFLMIHDHIIVIRTVIILACFNTIIIAIQILAIIIAINLDRVNTILIAINLDHIIVGEFLPSLTVTLPPPFVCMVKTDF